MKARSILRKFIGILLLAALTLMLGISAAAASSTTLTTTVPKTLPLRLELRGSGTVTVNGITYTNSGTIEIPRNSGIELHITPDAENKIKSVIYNGRNYTSEAISGKFTLPAITERAKLSVSFIKVPSAPPTGDSYSPLCLTLLMFLSLTGMIATFYFWKRKV